MFEMRRKAINLSLKALEQEAFLGLAPINIRFHQIEGWSFEEFNIWADSDRIHPCKSQLKEKYTMQLMKAIRSSKNNPATLVCLNEQIRQINWNFIPTNARVTLSDISKRRKHTREERRKNRLISIK